MVRCIIHSSPSLITCVQIQANNLLFTEEKELCDLHWQFLHSYHRSPLSCRDAVGSLILSAM